MLSQIHSIQAYRTERLWKKRAYLQKDLCGWKATFCQKKAKWFFKIKWLISYEAEMEKAKAEAEISPQELKYETPNPLPDRKIRPLPNEN